MSASDGRLRGAGPRRPIADRYLRVWRIVEMVAARPGLQRKILSRELALSERQVQGDLSLIRSDLGLPLVKGQGYAFEGHDRSVLQLGVRDALALAALLAGRTDDLAARLAGLFPPHLRPIFRLLLTHGDRAEARLAAVLVTAALAGAAVKLRYALDAPLGWAREALTVQPLLLLPIRGRWYLLALLADARRRLIPLDTIAEVGPAFAERRAS